MQKILDKVLFISRLFFLTLRLTHEVGKSITYIKGQNKECNKLFLIGSSCKNVLKDILGKIGII